MRLPDPQRSRVVLIGTAKYTDEDLPDLPSVGKGISDLEATLTDREHGLVPGNHCTVLADKRDIPLIGHSLRRAASQAEDLLLVYYSGHGLIAGRRHELYLALTDSECTEPEFNSLEYDKLRTAVLDSPATTKVIVLDCCFSGRVITDTMTDPVSEAISHMEIEGTYVLASAHRDKVSLVIPGEAHTAFTGRLLRLLREGVAGGSEFLTIDDLYEQLLVKMKAEGLPHPQKRGTDSAGLLALAKNRAWATQSAIKQRPMITVEDAIAELDEVVGQSTIKGQVQSIATATEAARRRAVAGISTEKPMRHFLFTGPRYSGQPEVARVLARIFYAFGLLDTPTVKVAQRADLVGEHSASISVQTNELIDSALGGVLFITEAHTLVTGGARHPDPLGMEAVQILLKRAEDNREDLIIILSDSEKQIEELLSVNPGLATCFATRVTFTSYSSTELLAMTYSLLKRRGEVLEAEAGSALEKILEDVRHQRIIDELGNSWFIYNLIDKAGQIRDVRIFSRSTDPEAVDLVAIHRGDLQQAFSELTDRLRGSSETPTLESALTELDGLIGLEEVRDRVRTITAQLRAAIFRDKLGLASQSPPRHFIFTGPPGTGKATIARILGDIFTALGFLTRPRVLETQRADLMGENPDATVTRTNRLIDSALGGVLFIDEASSLRNESYGDGDALGACAVQTLLRRANEGTDRLIIILADRRADMDRFLSANSGLGSRFRTRIDFPSYSADELTGFTRLLARQTEDMIDADAAQVLDEIFRRVCQAGRIDELGNTRYARSLFERACAYRDLRVVKLEDRATAEDLTTLTTSDIRAACKELEGGQTGTPDRQPARRPDDGPAS